MDDVKLDPIIQQITDDLLSGKGVHHLQGCTLPSWEAVAQVLMYARRLAFPGYDHRVGSPDEYRASVDVWIRGLAATLHKQVVQELIYQRGLRDCDDSEVHSAAEEITLDALAALPKFRAALADDVAALLDGDPAAYTQEEVVLAYPGLEAIFVHRVAHFFWRRDVRLIARMMGEITHSKTGIDIHPGARIGTHFHIDHGTGVVIGETCEIGHHVKIYQGVSLGALSVSKEKQQQKRHPTIEDNVTIYAGATILGGDTRIGHDSVIGGNVWLVDSVPPHSRVENTPHVKVSQR